MNLFKYIHSFHRLLVSLFSLMYAASCISSSYNEYPNVIMNILMHQSILILGVMVQFLYRISMA